MDKIALVEEQLKGYNSRDIDRFSAVFSDNVTVYSLKEEKVLMQGLAAFRESYKKLFDESPNLNAKISHRSSVGDFVIDHEEVSGRRNQTLQAVAIYKITGDKISHVWFAI